MKKVYYPTEIYNENTQGFYKIFEVADDFPTLYELVEVGPSEDLKYPRFNRQTGKWEPDFEKVTKEIMTKQDEQGAAMLEALNSMMGAIAEGGDSDVNAN